MANVTVIGAQWGDEGKGKIVDWLASRADAVVRFQGGHNAGHTLVIDGTTYKLSLLPSGIVSGTLSVIGNGVVLDPWALKAEIEKLEAQGVTINDDNLAVADNCPLILPIHRDLDGLREAAAGSGKIGTTGRGIGPAYEDKVGRRAIRVCDLAHLDALEPQLDRLCAHHDALRAGFEQEPVDREQLLAELREIAPFVLKYAQPVWKRLKKVRKAGAKILFEGAQGVLLDIDHGTYPFVTSSNCVAGAVCTGAGVGPTRIDQVLGITKAYTTRVGGGPFPTEDEGPGGQWLGEKGHEFGATTGRRRRCGWLDMVVLREAAIVNGFTSLALNKLDILSGLDEIPVARAWRIDGKVTEDFPMTLQEVARAEPVYEALPGWSEDLTGMREYEELPENARRYVEQVQAWVGVPVDVISIGPGRDQTIYRRRLFE